MAVSNWTGPRGWLAMVVHGLLLAACNQPGASEVLAFSGVTGDLRWSRQVEGESVGVYAVGCGDEELPHARDCRQDVAVIGSYDPCEEESWQRGVAVESGRDAKVPAGTQRPINGDPRIDPSWDAGSRVCAEIGAGEPYFVQRAPRVEGVCLFSCVGEPPGTRGRGACTVAAVEVGSKRELWRMDVESQRDIEARGSWILLHGVNEQGAPVLSRLDVGTGEPLWTKEFSERPYGLGTIADMLFVPRTRARSECEGQY